MKTKHPSKYWVIDADIARSAGETEHTVSKTCRCFLEDIRKNKRHIVMTKEIKAEWIKHRSIFSKTWLSSMIAGRQMKSVNIPEKKRLEIKVETLDLTDRQKKIAIKDSHLIDAALETDKCLASRDDNARNVYILITSHFSELNNIIWINPVNTPFKLLLKWLTSDKEQDGNVLLKKEPEI